MHYHIILTERCNLKCKYCYEKSMQEFENGLEKKWDYDSDVPINSEVSIESLKKFLSKEDTLIFYGGEPLLMIEKIKEMMDNLDCRFCMQTNGTLLDKLPIEYLKRMDKVLVSIDGDKERTDYNRGEGKYEIVIENLRKARELGFKGEFVARMTISFPDVFEQVMHLVGLIKEGIFDSIHWQIDAGFYKFDFDYEKFSKFVREYNSSIERLLDWWVAEMEGGKVWNIYPFLGVYDSLKTGVRANLPCGSGHANYTISTCGNLSACPIMNSVRNLYCGNLNSSKKDIKKIHIVHDDCLACDYFDVCGGRCLYWREAQLWPKEGDDLICKTVKFLIDGMRKRMEKIDSLIEVGKVSSKDFVFEKYFGPEIIP